jgi:hypothetical protein
VLRSFHYQHDYDALPRLLLTCLETSTLLRTTLDVNRDGRSSDGRTPLTGVSVLEIHDAARAVREQLAPEPERSEPARSGPPAEQRRAWAAHHREMVAALEESGVPVRTDDAATEEYVELRAEWDGGLDELAQALLYEWPDEPLAPSRERPRR